MLQRILILLTALLLPVAAQTKHAFSLDDLDKFIDVREAQCSPDGKFVAYVQSQTDVKADRAGNSLDRVLPEEPGGQPQAGGSDNQPSASHEPNASYEPAPVCTDDGC